MITRDTIVKDLAFLETHCEPLTEENLSEEIALIEEAAAWVRDPENNALGLASTQVGSKRAWFVMRNHSEGRQISPSPGSDPVLVFANPKILEFKGQNVWRIEACFSLPNEGWKVRRNTDIFARYQLIENGKIGKKRKSIFSGLAAQVFQHESSHVRGTLISHFGAQMTGPRPKEDVETVTGAEDPKPNEIPVTVVKSSDETPASV